MPKDAQVAYVYGQVVDATTKKPVVNASIDIWEASTNGGWKTNNWKLNATD
jgi:catechol 1,2-dioxygenase